MTGITEQVAATLYGGIEWLKHLVLGEFDEDRPISVVVATMLICFVPGVVIVICARDLAAILTRLAKHPEKRELVEEWMLLIACAVPLTLPLLAAAVGAAAGPVVALAGGIAGSELGATLRVVCLKLIDKSAVSLAELVGFLRIFIKGDILKVLTDIKFAHYQQALTKLITDFIGILTRYIAETQSYLTKLPGGVLVDRTVKGLQKSQDAFYAVQVRAPTAIWAALKELDLRLQTVRQQSLHPNPYPTVVGAKAPEVVAMSTPTAMQVRSPLGQYPRVRESFQSNDRVTPVEPIRKPPNPPPNPPPGAQKIASDLQEIEALSIREIFAIYSFRQSPWGHSAVEESQRYELWKRTIEHRFSSKQWVATGVSEPAEMIEPIFQIVRKKQPYERELSLHLDKFFKTLHPETPRHSLNVDLAIIEKARLYATREDGTKIWFYRPTSKLVDDTLLNSPIVRGKIDPAGDIVVRMPELSLSTRDAEDTLRKIYYHERVHQILTPTFIPFREFRISIRTDAYNNQLMRYLEEVLAESVARFRVHGVSGDFFWESIQFPLNASYGLQYHVVLGQAAAATIGYITIEGLVYSVSRATLGLVEQAAPSAAVTAPGTASSAPKH